MANGTVSSPAPRKRRLWLRVLVWIVAVLIVLVVAAYFVGTSSSFFKTAILPRASKSLNAQITVSDADIHPFKEVVLHNLKVQTTGTEPLISAPEVVARYSLMDMIGGKINVDEVVLTSPTVVLVENADGTSNLDPFTKAQEKKPTEKKGENPSKPSKPAQIDLKKFALTDATVRKIKIYKNGDRDVTELSHINITLDNLKNGANGKLTVAADAKIENHPPAPASSGLLQAKASGSFDFTLSPDLKPSSVKGNTHLEVTHAEGALAQASAFSSDLDADLTPTEIKQVALRFQQGGAPLGQVRISGPLDMDKTEGHLAVEILSIDKRLLNLIGAKSGIDFGPTTISSTNQIQLAKSGSMITVAGALDINKFSVSRTNQTTPSLDLAARYNLTIDRAASNAVLHELTFTGIQNQNPVLKAQLTSPMNFSWGNTSNAVGNSDLKVTVSKFNFADWKTILGDVAPAGVLNAEMKLSSEQGGQHLAFALDSEIANLTAGSVSNQITQADVRLQMKGEAANLQKFTISQGQLSLARQNQSLLTASVSGTYDKMSQGADMQLSGQLALARLLQVLPRSDMSVTSGDVDLKVHLTQKAEATRTVQGTLQLADLTGKIAKNEFQNFGATADLDITTTPQQVQIRKVGGKLTQGANPGGTFDVSGTYDLSTKAAQITAKLTDFNQNGLRPFLEPMLADKKLVSVALNASAAVQYNPDGDSAVKADLKVANLVVNDPKNQFPASPLEVSLATDVALHKKSADIRLFQIGLTPTARATNQVQITGKLDMSDTNALQGNLKVAANSLDLTTYYDLFSGEKKTAKPETKAPAQNAPSQAVASGGREQEPQSKQLPLRNFLAEANIGRLYLREIDMADWQTTAKVEGSHAVLNPFKLTLNGAPVNMSIDVDLSVPGYKYDFSLGAQAIPLAPVVDSFQPERKGQVGGTLTAQAKISGTGTSGESLQKTLAGQFDIFSTNLNLSVVNIKSPLLKQLINVIAKLPELMRNPEGAVTSLIGGITGKAGTSGGLADELQKSPIDSIVAKGSAGAGRVELQQAIVRSKAFEADAKGAITLAPVLTNSTVQIPVSVFLSQAIAQSINLAPANGQTNSGYAKLPDFLTMKGTVGNPKPEINKLALAGTALKGITGAIPGGGKVGGVLQGLGGLLPGSAPAQTNAPAATNQNPVGDLLNQFLKPKK